MAECTGEGPIIIEIFGEGKTDIGKVSKLPREPDSGVVPILTHRLCGEPGTMQVKTRPYGHLQGKGLWQKVKFAKRQAHYNQGTRGAVFVMDTEGDHKVIGELAKGRNSEFPGFPLAIGVAHPCTEAWLLADPDALCQILGISNPIELPAAPESLPAPLKHRSHNPKTELAKFRPKFDTSNS